MPLEEFSLGEKDGLALILKATEQKHLPKFRLNLNTAPEKHPEIAVKQDPPVTANDVT